MKKTMVILAALLSGVMFSASSCEDPNIPSADENTPSVTAGMGFDDPRYDDYADRDDPCVWFDGYQNEAAQVTINIYATSSGGQGLKQIYPPQNFVDGQDFFGGNPNGLHFQVPATGEFIMEVIAYGKPNEDCCPGPPVGRPVFKTIWPPTSYNGYPAFFNMLRFHNCLYF